MHDRMLPTREVAKWLGITEECVRTKIRSREIPASNIAREGSARPTYRVSRRDLEDYIRGCRVRGTDWAGLEARHKRDVMLRNIPKHLPFDQ